MTIAAEGGPTPPTVPDAAARVLEFTQVARPADLPLIINALSPEELAAGIARLGPRLPPAVIEHVVTHGPPAARRTLAWQLRRIDPSVRRASAAWWLCVEQDRSIVCGLQRGRVAAMNAGAPPLRDEAHAQRLAAVEARRRGWPPAHEPASFAGWFAAADATASPPVAARPTQALA